MTRLAADQIRQLERSEMTSVLAVINDAARTYQGVIPDDRWREPYMTRTELAEEWEEGVRFWGWEEDASVIGVMGVQEVAEVTLIRHAYVRTDRQGEGIGSALLRYLLSRTDRPVLVGTWAAAERAIAFYRTHGFEVVSDPEGSRLLRRYWSIPERQVETSVVLADEEWHHGARD